MKKQLILFFTFSLCVLSFSFSQGPTKGSNENYAVILRKTDFTNQITYANTLAYHTKMVEDGFLTFQNPGSNTTNRNWWHKWGRKTVAIISCTSLGLALGSRNKSIQNSLLSPEAAMTLGAVSGAFFGFVIAFPQK